MKKKAILIVLDSLGVGALGDAFLYGDEGSNTLSHTLQQSEGISLPNLQTLGLLNIAGIKRGIPRPIARYGKLREVSPGKDTTTGHWEMAGLRLEQPFPTFPNGFPNGFIEAFERETGRGCLGNTVASGTAIIEDLGEEQMKTGKWIVYTSADSVFQIAAHEEIIPLEELYEACRTARRLLTGDLAVGRVIARPYIGAPGQFTRTANRHDYSLEPIGDTMLDTLKAKGRDVIGVGKISDIFAGRGLTKSIPTKGNTHGIEVLLQEARQDFDGLLFVNLVDFDSAYGHRRDALGYANALMEFDRCLPALINGLDSNSILLITGDHGCDPTFKGTDHTREYVPLIRFQNGGPVYPYGEVRGLDFVSKLVLEHLL